MIPNQYRRPSARVMETTEDLLRKGHVMSATYNMNYALGVIATEREQLRADRDAALLKLNAGSPFNPFRVIVDEVFAPLGQALADVIKFMQKPTRPSDFGKVK